MLTNDQMKAGRFLKLAKGRALFARMSACWDRGGFVRVGTCTRYAIADVVLAYRPKPKTKPARKRARRKRKADAASRA